MSLWKFGDFEADIDFTDADFLDLLEEAKSCLDEDVKKVPKTGKTSDIIRAQISCFDHFFDHILGAGAAELIRGGKQSLEVSLSAVESLNQFYDQEDQRVDSKFDKYNVQNHGNRQQRRNYNKNPKKQNGKRY